MSPSSYTISRILEEGLCVARAHEHEQCTASHRHPVVVIYMENKERSTVVGSSSAQSMLNAGATVVLTYDEGSSGAGINGTTGGGNITRWWSVPVSADASTRARPTTTHCWRPSRGGSV